MGKVLVVGGAGFIGSNLADALIEKGYEVHVIDDLSTGKEEYINPKILSGEQGEFYKASILNEGFLDGMFAQNEFDAIFHLAAWPRVPRSIEDPVGTHKVNVDGFLNILQMARKYAVGKVIYSSSSSVYGDQNTPQMVEDMVPNPKSPYALHKLIGEQYATMFSKLFDISIVSLRYFNVYGYRQATEGAYCLVIGKFIQQKKEGLALTVYGDGTQTRAYTHVTDIVNANILALEKDIEKGKNLIVNIGTEREISINEVANMIGGEMSYVIPNPRGDFEEKRKAANPALAKEKLGWEPKVTFEEGMKQLL